MGLLVLSTDAVLRARLAGALRGRVQAVWCCGTVEEARGALARGGVRALVVEARDGRGRHCDVLVREARERWPALPIVAVWEPGVTGTADARALLEAGVHELLVRSMDDGAHALRAAIAAGEQQCLGALVVDATRPYVPVRVWPVAEYFLRRAAEPATIAECAAALGVHRKTLVNRLRDAGCPPPLVVRAWCRLLVVARLLDESGRTIESIALQLDYPSATALRNQARRFLGVRLRDLAANGGFAFALSRFGTIMRGSDGDTSADVGPETSDAYGAVRSIPSVRRGGSLNRPTAESSVAVDTSSGGSGPSDFRADRLRTDGPAGNTPAPASGAITSTSQDLERATVAPPQSITGTAGRPAGPDPVSAEACLPYDGTVPLRRVAEPHVDGAG